MRKALILSALLTALAAGQASAHARLLHAAPKVGSTVAQAPTELRFWFSETIEAKGSSVTLSGPGGKQVMLGRLAVDAKDPRVVVVPIQGAVPAGRYHVDWRMTSADTHRMGGDFFFSVKR
jgi:copper resistance protein C